MSPGLHPESLFAFLDIPHLEVHYLDFAFFNDFDVMPAIRRAARPGDHQPHPGMNIRAARMGKQLEAGSLFSSDKNFRVFRPRR